MPPGEWDFRRVLWNKVNMQRFQRSRGKFSVLMLLQVGNENVLAVNRPGMSNPDTRWIKFLQQVVYGASKTLFYARQYFQIRMDSYSHVHWSSQPKGISPCSNSQGISSFRHRDRTFNSHTNKKKTGQIKCKLIFFFVICIIQIYTLDL